ncbi:class I SAM-dependent methyltransferase [Caulobacter segnis]|uniref:class I SAM-dependent methyltransferase n=1 Tax=Caulobacter segnis TaxID=88688 RepID=UPI002862CE0E|nr:class I SAM-dependent methyltransferase [Caulobacter segnis]MDR6625421.1 SAM-dependent methyltransferase [Caulobacter segnis]
MKVPVNSAFEAVAHDPATLGFYADRARVYAYSARDGPSQRLDAFLKRLCPGARILELGCGDGRDSQAMLTLGFDVDPTDGVASMARQAEARLGRPVRVMRFDELDCTQTYDGVWANASLLHVPRLAFPSVVARIHRALKPGGIHAASYKAGEAEGRDGLGRYFNYFSAEALAAAYRSGADWEFLSVESHVGGDYEGGSRPWITITVRRST